ncbi:MAG: hypothetical protein OEW60_04000, partial [Thiovulaceae bacterium]|nr:hypothetical protein [Sulfurimonadaceae bacterium]
NTGVSFSKYNGIRVKDGTSAKFVNGSVSGFTGIDPVDTSAMFHVATVATGGITVNGTALNASAAAGLAYAEGGSESAATIFATGTNGNSDVNDASATAVNPSTLLGDAFIDAQISLGYQDASGDWRGFAAGTY